MDVSCGAYRHASHFVGYHTLGCAVSVVSDFQKEEKANFSTGLDVFGQGVDRLL
jgi:hypothetical protein